MKKLVYISLLVFTLSSCTPILKLMYGIKKPKIENSTSLIKKAQKFKLDTNNILTANEDDCLEIMFKQGIPDADIFDRDGRYIEYRVSDSACNAGLFEFIPNLCKNQNFNIIDSISLSSKLSKFRDINGNELMPLDEADFYILIYWTVWTGKLNKDHVKIWEQLATNNTDCKIKVLKVNLDLQEHWSSEKLDQYIRLFK